jgi:stage II sporulation protein M
MTSEGGAVFNTGLSVKRVIIDNRIWLMLAAILFLVSSGAVYTVGLSQAVIPPEAFSGLEKLVDRIMGMPPFAAALFVFVNNLISMVQMLVLGFAAGLSPILTLALNGGLVGALVAMTADEGLPVFRLVAVTILPHGIFELSAFFLCGGLGLKFGYHCTVSPLPGRTRMQSFKYIWKEAATILPLVVLLLFVAAFVEIYITSYLAGRMLPFPA